MIGPADALEKLRQVYMQHIAYIGSGTVPSGVQNYRIGTTTIVEIFGMDRDEMDMDELDMGNLLEHEFLWDISLQLHVEGSNIQFTAGTDHEDDNDDPLDLDNDYIDDYSPRDHYY